MKRYLLAFSVGLLATGANAAVVTRTYTFTATNFSAFQSTAAAPVDPVTGSFTVTFDDTQPFTNRTTGIAQNALNIPYDNTLAFTRFTDGGLAIGAISVTDVSTNSRDFRLNVSNPTALGSLNGAFAYSSAGTLFTAQGLSILSTAAVGVVPEPKTWAMLIGGFGFVGGALRRRGRRTVAIRYG